MSFFLLPWIALLAIAAVRIWQDSSSATAKVLCLLNIFYLLLLIIS